MRILHLIHETSFGGVEAAAEELRQVCGSGRPAESEVSPSRGADDVTYRVAALSRKEPEVVHADVAGTGVNSPRAACLLIREIRRQQPDVLVTSLWRTLALGLAVRALSPRTTWIIWVHLSRYTNWLDRAMHRLALPRADAIMCDSEAAHQELIRPELARLGAAVAVHIVRPEAEPLPLVPKTHGPAPDEPVRLVFWGRVARQKRLDRALELVAELCRTRPGGAELTIIGPDSGELAHLDAQAQRLGIASRITHIPPADHEQIAAVGSRADAFVQLSEAEGFARSAHEALGSGLVCVLTPVGDLARDTHDGVDALHHHGDIPATARRLVALLTDDTARRQMSEQARRTAGVGFVDTFIGVCRDISEGIGS